MQENYELLKERIRFLEEELEYSKKYGLVWEKEKVKEDVVLLCEENIPILLNNKEKNIKKGVLNNVLIEGDNYHSLTSLSFILKDYLQFHSILSIT